MGESDFDRWLVLEPGQRFVRFGDLAHLIASALHPVADEDREYDFHYGAARVNLEDDELPAAVSKGELRPLDRLTRGPHPMPASPLLEDALIDVDNLSEFLRPRRIGVRERPRVAPAHSAGTSSAAHAVEALGTKAAEPVPAPKADAAAEPAPEANGTSRIEPVARWKAQEGTILNKLRELGYSPSALPRHEAWKPGVKSEVRSAIGSQGMWQSQNVFDKAWERLRESGEIADKP